MLCVQTILFTLDDDVLFRVSHHDSVYQTDQSESLDPSPIVEYEVNRPETADYDNNNGKGEFLGVLRRPFTQSKSQEVLLMNRSQPKKESVVDPEYVLGSEIQVILKSNWGDSSSIGMTGLSVLLADSQEPLQIRTDQLDVVMPPSKSQEGSNVHQQVTEISTLVDGDNVTTDAAHMWVCMLPADLADGGNPCTTCPTVVLKLDEPKLLKGLRVWNYNGSLEDSYKGVRKQNSGCCCCCCSSYCGYYIQLLLFLLLLLPLKFGFFSQIKIAYFYFLSALLKHMCTYVSYAVCSYVNMYLCWFR